MYFQQIINFLMCYAIRVINHHTEEQFTFSTDFEQSSEGDLVRCMLCDTSSCMY